MIDEIIAQIKNLQQEKDDLIILIDGRATSGKTVLAQHLADQYQANLIHIDDFYLPQTKRQPGIAGNIDHKRLINDILIPIQKHQEYDYQPFDCHIQSLQIAKHIKYQRIHIIEGTYTFYLCQEIQSDLKIFLDVDQTHQIKRIISRNAESLSAFQNIWIPLEEKYFQTYQTRSYADLYFDTSQLF